MMLVLHRSEFFDEDFDLQFRWYLARAGEEIAERYLAAVLVSLRSLCRQPDLGRLRRFRSAELKGIRSYRVQPPFNVHLIFYRCSESELVAERVMHGARDLPRRLLEPPEL
jgi:plasmid stabilization system protein ParE